MNILEKQPESRNRLEWIIHDIPLKLIHRFSDEEESVQDLAKKLIASMLLKPFKFLSFQSTNTFEDICESIDSNACIANFTSLSFPQKSEISDRSMIFSIMFSNSFASEVFTKYLQEICQAKKNGVVANSFQLQTHLVIRSLIEHNASELITVQNEGSDLKEPELSNILKSLHAFSMILPNSVATFLGLIRPHMNAVQIQSASSNQKSFTIHELLSAETAISILKECFKSINIFDQQLLELIEQDLIQIINNGTTCFLSLSVETMCNIANYYSKNYQRITLIFKKCLGII